MDELAVTRSEVKDAQANGPTLYDSLPNNAKSALQTYKTALKSMIDTVNNATAPISDLEEDIEERMRAVAVPDFKSLVDLPVNCAKGKGPYMKVYASFEGNSVLTGSGQLFRLSLHQRNGFKFAWNDFTGFNDGFKIKSIDYSWEELLTAVTNSRNSYQKLGNTNCPKQSWQNYLGEGNTLEECKSACNKLPIGDGSNHCSFFLWKESEGKCWLRDGSTDGTGCSSNNNLDTYTRSFASLDDSPGVENEMCWMLFCIRLNLKLTQKMRNLMGVDLSNSMNLDLSDDVYFFTFDLKFFDITLKKLSIPVTLSIPIDDIFPSMLVPFIVTIPTPVVPPEVPQIEESGIGSLTTAARANLQKSLGEESVADQQKPTYYALSPGDKRCPEGHDIMTETECKMAVMDLGLCIGNNGVWTGDSKYWHAFCGLMMACPNQPIRFNAHSVGNTGRSDTTPICRQPGTLKQMDICGDEDGELGTVDSAEGELEDDLTDDDVNGD